MYACICIGTCKIGDSCIYMCIRKCSVCMSVLDYNDRRVLKQLADNSSSQETKGEINITCLCSKVDLNSNTMSTEFL